MNGKTLNLDRTVELEKVATNVNYLMAKEGLKSLVVISDKKGEGKTTFIHSIAPILNRLYSKRILVINEVLDNSDNLSTLLGVKKSSKIITKTSCKGIDYVDLSLANINIEDSYEFYDLILINTQTKREQGKFDIKSQNIDGAILITSKKSKKIIDGEVTNMILDQNIPIVGVLFNGGI